jgi:hypothetical protein
MASILFSLIGVVIATIVPFMVYRHSVWKDKYKLDIELIAEYEKKPCNKYLVERLFFWLTKCPNVTCDEIGYLLSSLHPSRSVTSYSQGGRFFKTCHIISENSAIFSDGFKTNGERWCKRLTLLAFYILICSLLSGIYLIITRTEVVNIPTSVDFNLIILQKISVFILLFITSLVLIASAFRCLSMHDSINSAEKFIEYFNNQPNELHSPIENEIPISTELDSTETSSS